MKFMNILIIKHGALGDVVRTSYFAKYLNNKYNNCNIHWITNPSSINILRFNPYVTNIVTTFDALANIQFDLVFSLDDENIFLQKLKNLSAKKIIGAYIDQYDNISYSDSSAQWFNMGLLSNLGKKKADNLKKRNKKSHIAIFSEIFGVEGVVPMYYGNEVVDDRVKNEVRKKGDYILGINAYAGPRWPSKSLLKQNYVNLIKIIFEHFIHIQKNLKIVILGSQEDSFKNYEVVNNFYNNKDSFILPNTENNLCLLSAYIKSLNYLITSDSLALHLAIAQKIPHTAFFTPTSSAEIGNNEHGNHVISLGDDYCSYRPNADNSSITAARIFKAFLNNNSNQL